MDLAWVPGRIVARAACSAHRQPPRRIHLWRPGPVAHETPKPASPAVWCRSEQCRKAIEMQSDQPPACEAPRTLIADRRTSAAASCRAPSVASACSWHSCNVEVAEPVRIQTAACGQAWQACMLLNADAAARSPASRTRCRSDCRTVPRVD